MPSMIRYAMNDRASPATMSTVPAALPYATAASGLVAAYAQFHLERGIRSLPHLESYR